MRPNKINKFLAKKVGNCISAQFEPSTYTYTKMVKILEKHNSSTVVAHILRVERVHTYSILYSSEHLSAIVPYILLQTNFM